MTHAECPSCDGYGYTGHDEAGLPYSCYVCGETGSVPADFRAAWDAAATDEREYRRYLPPMVLRFFDDEGSAWPEHRKLLPASILPKRVPVYCTDDDIPF